MKAIIEGPANWRGPELAGSQDWIHVFSTQEVAEIEAALRAVKARGLGLADLRKEDFPLPVVQRVLAEGLERLETGRGLHLFRGFPAERYGKDDLRLAYWGLGLHLGTAVSQSSNGDLLGDVRNLNSSPYAPKGRGYTSKDKLSYHTDFADVVGLFVLRAAKSGGLSIIGSSIAIHNEIARRRPDLLEVMYGPFPYSWQGQEAPGERPWYQLPFFSVTQGKFACTYVRSHIMLSQRFEDAPRLTPQQLEAMDLFDELAASADFHLAMMFEPGDLQFINNHVLYHSRTAFEDYDEPDRKRHLLRLWLSVQNSRPLARGLAAIYGDGRPGALRGGFPSRTGRFVYETTEPVT
jgi:hypothetical protein